MDRQVKQEATNRAKKGHFLWTKKGVTSMKLVKAAKDIAESILFDTKVGLICRRAPNWRAKSSLTRKERRYNSYRGHMKAAKE